jgi:CHAD domain-containing protein
VLRETSAAVLLAAVPDPRMRRALERAAAGKLLAPRVETHVRRTTRRLRLGTAQIEAALDIGEVRAGRKSLPIRELELERISGPARAVYDVGLRLAEELALRPGLFGKAERGFARLAGREPQPVRAERPAFPRGATLEAVLAAALGECLRHMTANQPAVEKSDDPEGVHQMRVGARRLRSALRLFRNQLPVRETELLVEDLRWLAGLLGAARDLDVFLGELLGPLAKGRPDDGGLAALRNAAEGARCDAYSTLRRELASRRYAALVLRLGRLVDGPSIRRRGASELARPAGPVARRLLRDRALRVKRLGARLAELSPQELHRLRIRAKRLRYAAELLAPLFGTEAERAARRLAELQDVLGHLNDQTTAEQLLAGLRERLPEATPELTRAEGFVSGWASSSAARGREQLADVWRRVERLKPFWD